MYKQPEEFYDNRIDKINGTINAKSPDFKHKKTKRGLWVESKNTPAWVIPRLQELPEPTSERTAMEQVWNSFFDDLSNWVDCRATKSESGPDFKHKTENDKALWLSSKLTPNWVGDRIADIGTMSTPSTWSWSLQKNI